MLTETSGRCPRCGTSTGSGYGFAFGGGVGGYEFCTSDTCEWFLKAPDREGLPEGTREIAPTSRGGRER